MRWGIVVGVAVVVLVAACSGGGAEPGGSDEPDESFVAEEFTGADKADFYEVPSPLPDVEHGTLLRYEHLSLPIEGGSSWKVMYLSESLAGDPIAVTGVVIVPEGEAPAGGWKLVSVAHGTTGVGDECALSSVDLPGSPARGDPEHPVSIVSDDLYLNLPEAGYLSAGYVVAVTDYEGLGTPGVHPYLVGESEGRSVVDAARAARQLPGIEVEGRYAVWGYSQGGHAAAWANEIGAAWAPDLDLVGSVAGAPPSETRLIAPALAYNDPSGDIFFMMMAGYAAAYPDLDPADVLTPRGLEVIAAAETGCFDIAAAMADRPMSDMVKPGLEELADWQDRLAENEPGQQKVAAPLLVLHSGGDTGVPAVLSELMFQRMCGLGQTIERRVYDQGEDHDAAVDDVITDGLRWIEALMSGDQAISTCPTAG
jgi:hypothetical protein